MSQALKNKVMAAHTEKPFASEQWALIQRIVQGEGGDLAQIHRFGALLMEACSNKLEIDALNLKPLKPKDPALSLEHLKAILEAARNQHNRDAGLKAVQQQQPRAMLNDAPSVMSGSTSSSSSSSSSYSSLGGYSFQSGPKTFTQEMNSGMGNYGDDDDSQTGGSFTDTSDRVQELSGEENRQPRRSLGEEPLVE